MAKKTAVVDPVEETPIGDWVTIKSYELCGFSKVPAEDLPLVRKMVKKVLKHLRKRGCVQFVYDDGIGVMVAVILKQSMGSIGIDYYENGKYLLIVECAKSVESWNVKMKGNQ